MKLKINNGEELDVKFSSILKIGLISWVALQVIIWAILGLGILIYWLLV